MRFIDTIITGIITFPIVAALFTMPYALYQYRRYSAISKYRTFIIYSFILYMLIAYFMVILPLPSRESTIGNTWQDHLNLIPFNQIIIYWSKKEFNLQNLLGYLKSFSLWQLLFNVLLTIPFGIYMHYYFRKSLKQTILYSFLLSLFYELSQLTALFGMYPGPYRLADIEDLFCNTLGGAIGFLIASLFMKILPDRDAIDERCRERGKKIGGWRRFWATVFDVLCFNVVYLFVYGLSAMLAPGISVYLEPGFKYPWTLFCIVMTIEVLLTKGTTLGHAICRMILVAEDGSVAPAWRVILRYLCLAMFTDLPIIIVSSLPDSASFIGDFLTLILVVLSRMYFIIYFLNVIRRKDVWLMPHDRISKTTYMSIELPDKKAEQ